MPTLLPDERPTTGVSRFGWLGADRMLVVAPGSTFAVMVFAATGSDHWGRLAVAIVLLAAGLATWPLRTSPRLSAAERLVPVVLVSFGLTTGLLLLRLIWSATAPRIWLGHAVLVLVLVLAMASQVFRRGQWQDDRLGWARSLVDAVQITLGMTCLYWFCVSVPDLAADPAQSPWGGLVVIAATIALGAMQCARPISIGGRLADLTVAYVVLTVAGTWLYLRAAGPAVTSQTEQALGQALAAAGVALAVPVLWQRVLRPGQPRPRPWWLSEVVPQVLHLGPWVFAATRLPGAGGGSFVWTLGSLSVATLAVRVWLVRIQERRLLRGLNRMAYLDPLTGIGNRRYLTQRLEQGSGWLLTVDLDGFTEVNERYGHGVGDGVLVAYAGQLKGMLPAGTALARLGGDEFAAILSGEQARVVALAHSMLDLHHQPGGTVTASIGLARLRPGASPEESLRACDIALRESKRAGRHRISILDEILRDTWLREYELSRQLAEDIAQGGIEIAFQPICELNATIGDGEAGSVRGPSPSGDRAGLAATPVAAVEVLARWRHPQLGPIPPNEFIAIAERHQLIESLGHLVLCRGLQQVRAWHQSGLRVGVTFNVSVLQLRDGAAVERLGALLADYRDVIGWVVLEVTETAFADEATVAHLQRLRQLGAAIAIDDFGTGASTLYSLRTLPFDLLKLDRGLIGPPNSAADPVVELILQFARRLGVPVVAEGIETADQLAALVDGACDYGQGYLLGRAMPASAVEPLLRRLTPETARSGPGLWLRARCPG